MKPPGCFLTHWLQMTTFSFVIVTKSLLPIRIQWSEKKKIFLFLVAFLKSTSIFQQFENMPILIAYLFLKLQTPKDCVRLISKKPRSETPFDSAMMLKVSYHLGNLHDSIFIKFFHHSGENCVGKCICF